MKIKVVALDFVGVLVKEKNIKLSKLQDKLERKFGLFNTDKEYYEWAEKETDLSVKELKRETEKIIHRLYKIRDPKIFKQFEEYRLVIATNHLSQLTPYIKKLNAYKNILNVFNSGDMNILKTSNSFYKIMCDKLKVKPEEILFIDDSLENIEKAKEFGLQTILYSSNMGILSNVIGEYLK